MYEVGCMSINWKQILYVWIFEVNQERSTIELMATLKSLAQSLFSFDFQLLLTFDIWIENI